MGTQDMNCRVICPFLPTLMCGGVGTLVPPYVVGKGKGGTNTASHAKSYQRSNSVASSFVSHLKEIFTKGKDQVVPRDLSFGDGHNLSNGWSMWRTLSPSQHGICIEVTGFFLLLSLLQQKAAKEHCGKTPLAIDWSRGRTWWMLLRDSRKHFGFCCLLGLCWVRHLCAPAFCPSPGFCRSSASL